MKLSWSEFYTWVQQVAAKKIRGIEPATLEWTFDNTPAAGFIGLGLHRFSGMRRAWLRFRERPGGVFYQVNDAAWCSMWRLDFRTLTEILDRLLHEFEADYNNRTSNPGKAAPISMLPAFQAA